MLDLKKLKKLERQLRLKKWLLNSRMQMQKQIAQDKPRLISVELMGGRRMFIVENRNINNETY